MVDGSCSIDIANEDGLKFEDKKPKKMQQKFFKYTGINNISMLKC